MNELPSVALKALNGGLFVVGFALIGEVVAPKRFSGLFGAAPSIALANLLVIVVAKGHAEAQREATGMIVGGVALVFACALGVVLIRNYSARRGSALLCLSWLVAAQLGYVLFLR